MAASPEAIFSEAGQTVRIGLDNNVAVEGVNHEAQ